MASLMALVQDLEGMQILAPRDQSWLVTPTRTPRDTFPYRDPVIPSHKVIEDTVM